MSQDPKFSIELHKLCGKLRDGEITQAESQRLNEMLRESYMARRFYRTFMALTSALESRTTLQEAVDQEADSNQNIEVLIELLQQEQAAEVVAFPAVPMAAESTPTRSREQPLDWRTVGDALGYLLSHTVKSAPAKWAAAAAVAVLAATLFVVLFGSPDVPESRPPVAATPDEPIRIGPAVASLTGEHNAVWDRRPGQDLYAGQRFRLTQGFAQITTSRGAVALLEAPATIELLDNDNDNAIRLHAGKLVGICETPSSKGFLVRTPHMDITDLGTRFGVDVTGRDQTEVHVIDGNVAVQWQKPGDARLFREELDAGEAFEAGASGAVRVAAYDPGRFVTDLVQAATRPRFAGGRLIWQGKVPSDLGQDKQQADALQVFVERQGLQLSEPVTVDLAPGSAWDPNIGAGTEQIGAGQRVDVYLLHLDMVAGHDASEDFDIDFGRPIVGVIGSQTLLDPSDATLGLPGVMYPRLQANKANAHLGGPRGINSREKDTEQLDTLSIDADGQTLRLNLWGGDGSSMDQIRVLVQSADGEGF